MSGSHGGISSAQYALAARPLIAVFNDAGVGKDEAGLAALPAPALAGATNGGGGRRGRNKRRQGRQENVVEDASLFAKQFKARFGLSPRDWREQGRGGSLPNPSPAI